MRKNTKFYIVMKLLLLWNISKYLKPKFLEYF